MNNKEDVARRVYVIRLLAYWGCPAKYRHVYPNLLMGDPYESEIREVALAARWPAEVTAALKEMVRCCDVKSLRAWDKGALVNIGRITFNMPNAKAFANGVIHALNALADEVARICG